MKFLERFALTIFSIIILVLSVVMLFIMFNVVKATIITKAIYYIMEDVMAFRIALGVIAVCILLAVKGIFFKSKKDDISKDGIVLENASGKLIISKESLENLVASVAKEIPGAEAVSSRTILDKDRNLKVYVTTTVARDVMLKEVSTILQDKIKSAMKETADLDVKEVNIKIKNISSKKIKSKLKKEETIKVDIQEETKEEVNSDENLEGEE